MSAEQNQSAERQKNLAITLGIALTVLAVEIVGGLLSGSLALLSDAAHVFADAGGIALSLFAVWMARRNATPQRTYGYYRVEILAALLNGAILLALSVFILAEAVVRWQNPTGVEGGLMVAAIIPSSPADQSGLQIGDVVTEINKRKVTALSQLGDALALGGAGQPVLLRYQRGDTARYVAIKPKD